MRVTAFSIILFFVCLNVALYIVHETQVLPFSQEPYEDPGDFTTTGTISYRLAGSLTLLGVTAMVAILSKNTYIALAGLTIWVADIFFPVFHWILFGFPEFATRLAAASGSPSQVYVVTTAMNALVAAVWFWFILGFVSGRSMEQ